MVGIIQNLIVNRNVSKNSNIPCYCLRSIKPGHIRFKLNTSRLLTTLSNILLKDIVYIHNQVTKNLKWQNNSEIYSMQSCSFMCFLTLFLHFPITSINLTITPFLSFTSISLFCSSWQRQYKGITSPLSSSSILRSNLKKSLLDIFFKFSYQYIIFLLREICCCLMCVMSWLYIL